MSVVLDRELAVTLAKMHGNFVYLVPLQLYFAPLNVKLEIYDIVRKPTC
jgi:hypothetical protein